MTAVRGTFADFKTVKTRGQCQAIIEFPIEDADHVLAVLGGIPQPSKEQWVGVAPISGVAESKDDAPDEPVTAKWTEAQRKMVQRAALVCKEPAFQNYIANNWTILWNHPRHSGLTPEDRAAYFVRTGCGVDSRSDIDPVKGSGGLFRDMMERYKAAQHGETTEAFERQRNEGPG